MKLRFETEVLIAIEEDGIGVCEVLGKIRVPCYFNEIGAARAIAASIYTIANASWLKGEGEMVWEAFKTWAETNERILSLESLLAWADEKGIDLTTRKQEVDQWMLEAATTA